MKPIFEEEETELRQCPFCKSVDVDSQQMDTVDSWPVIKWECNNCGAEGESH